jgi:TrmH family RNA methyltransferase
MLSTSQQKLLASLSFKKYRQKYRKFVVEGDKIASELLTQRQIVVERIFATERWAEQNPSLLQPFLDIFNPVTEAELKKISGMQTPNQVLLLANMPEKVADPAELAPDFCFYADGIQDPGNLGVLLRIADWFGFPAVFCAPDTVDVYSPKVIQASMGAFLRVKTAEIELSELCSALPDWPVLGAVLGGNSIFSADLPKHGLLVVGREGRGLSAEAEQKLQYRLTIPRHLNGGAESLNAGVAAGILAAVIRDRQIVG